MAKEIGAAEPHRLGDKGRRTDNNWRARKREWSLTTNATKRTSAVKPEAKPSDLALEVGGVVTGVICQNTFCERERLSLPGEETRVD